MPPQNQVFERENQNEKLPKKIQNTQLSSYTISSIGLYVVLMAFLLISKYLNIPYFTMARNYLEELWSNQIEYRNNDHYYIVSDLSFLHLYIFVIVGLLYSFVDATGWPKFFSKYKTQPDKNHPVKPIFLFKALCYVILNFGPVSYIFLHAWYYLRNWRGYDQNVKIPSLETVAKELFLCLLSYDIFLFHTHRLFHSRYFYHFHKIHHTFQAPFAITAVYAHPLEHFFVNLLSVYSGSVLLGSHLFTWWIFTLYASLYTLCDHSGYHLPFMFSNEMHDYHHLKTNECFGHWGIMDYLYGTDKTFRTLNASRHKIILSLRPPRELIPDKNRIRRKEETKN